MEGAWYELNVQSAKGRSKGPRFVPVAFYAHSLDSLNPIRGSLVTVSNSCSNMRQLLEIKVRKTWENQQTARLMLKIQFRLFVDRNLKDDVGAAATINQKQKESVIYKLQGFLFPQEGPATCTNGIFRVNLPGST